MRSTSHSGRVFLECRALQLFGRGVVIVWLKVLLGYAFLTLRLCPRHVWVLSWIKLQSVRSDRQQIDRYVDTLFVLWESRYGAHSGIFVIIHCIRNTYTVSKIKPLNWSFCSQWNKTLHTFPHSVSRGTNSKNALLVLLLHLNTEEVKKKTVQWENWPGSTRACCAVARSEEPTAVAGPRSVSVAVPVTESVGSEGGSESLWGLAVWNRPHKPLTV